MENTPNVYGNMTYFSTVASTVSVHLDLAYPILFTVGLKLHHFQGFVGSNFGYVTYFTCVHIFGHRGRGQNKGVEHSLSKLKNLTMKEYLLQIISSVLNLQKW